MKKLKKKSQKLIIVIAVLVGLYFLMSIYSYIYSCISYSKKLEPYKKDFELISQRLIDLKNEYNVDEVWWSDYDFFFHLYNKIDGKDVKIKEIPLNENEINALPSFRRLRPKYPISLIMLENEKIRFTIEGNHYGYVKVLKFKTANKIKKEIPVYDDLFPFYLGDGYYYFTSD